jgi:hypothetical protein
MLGGVRRPGEVISAQVVIAGSGSWFFIVAAVTRDWTTAVDGRRVGESVLVVSLVLTCVLEDVVEASEVLADEVDGEPGGIKPVPVSLIVSDAEEVELAVEAAEACRLRDATGDLERSRLLILAV